MAKQFDPWHAEQLADWRNRLASFVEAPAEPVFHAASFLALGGVLVSILATSLRTNADAIMQLLLEWRWLTVVALGVLCLLLQIRSFKSRGLTRLNGWLAAQPIEQRVWRRNARLNAVWIAALQIVAATVLGFLISASPSMLLSAAACALAGGFLVSLWPTPLSASHFDAQSLTTGGLGVGRMWRWQLIEARSILGPRRLASMFVLMFLVPSNPRILAIAFSLLAVLSLGLLAGAFQRSLAVLPFVHRWLATQPVRARALLRAWVLFPAAVVGLSILMLTLALSTLGVARLIGPIALAILVFSGLTMACVAAERNNPRRIGVQLSLHVVILLVVTQSLPPAAAVIWPLQMAWLLRRSLVE